MGGGEVVHLGSRGEAPGRVFKSVPPDGLFQLDAVDTEGGAVCTARNPRCWDPLYATVGGIEGRLYPIPVRGQERG